VRYCNEEVIRFLVSHDAKIDVVNNVGSEAFLEAYYGKRFDNFSIIQELGHTAAKYGGQLLRHAVSDRNYKVLEFLIEHGADINYNKSDMVYSNKSTPLCVAARYVDLEMCKFLVKHGADVTIAEKDGMRPYSIALEKGDAEITYAVNPRSKNNPPVVNMPESKPLKTGTTYRASSKIKSTKQRAEKS